MATPSTPSTIPGPPSSNPSDGNQNPAPDPQASQLQTLASPPTTASLSSSPSLPPHPSNNDLPPSPSLREISSLASWTVSTYKPGCGVRELLLPTTALFWQSDGPQPHLLTIHFFKVVSVVRMRVYLDYELDESYTPTRMVFAAGMGEYDLVEFAEWRGESPQGWVEVGLEGAGGRRGGYGYGSGLGGSEEGIEGLDLEEGGLEFENDEEDEEEEEGGVLRCMCVQVRVLENHQNGKDTHVRGVQLFARDERVKRRRRAVPRNPVDRAVEGDQAAAAEDAQAAAAAADAMREAEISLGLMEADWMGEPEIR